MALTAKQKRFVAEYMLDLNATQAAIRAGYSPKTARVVGSENLTKPDIERAIAEAQGAREKRLDISADHVLEELARIAFADTTSAIRVEDGRVVVQDTDEMDENTRRAISEISETVTTNGGTLKVKFHDKVKALELLSRHLGILNDKLSVNAKTEVSCDEGLEALLSDPESRKLLAALYARSTAGGVSGAGKD
jgi:phage terminase small subunit